MKKLIQTTKVLSVAILAVSIVACGGSKEKGGAITVKPKTTTIQGDLGAYYQVVDKECQIKPPDENSLVKESIITVEVMRNDKAFPFSVDKVNPVGVSGGEDYDAGFGIELFDDNGPVVIKNAADGGMGGCYSHDDITGLLKLKSGETGFIRWSIGEKTDGLKSFQLTSVLQKADNSSASSDNSAAVSGSAESDTNTDGLIKSYSDCLDQYIKLLQSAKKGDDAGVEAYTDMYHKADDLNRKLDEAKGNMTAEQAQKLIKLDAKFEKAVADMQGKNN